MVNSRSLDHTFAALSDPTRRAILSQLSQGESTVSELAKPFDISLPAVSKHLRVLEEAGLLQKRHQGRTVYCRLNADPIKEAADWIGRYKTFWTSRLDRLEAFLDKEEHS